MKRLAILSAMTMLGVLACNQEEETTASNPAPAPADNSASGQRIVSEITVSNGKVTFLANSGYIAIIEARTGTKRILGEEMVGLTLAEVHLRLAPGKQVPQELLDSHDRFETAGQPNTDVVDSQGSQSAVNSQGSQSSDYSSTSQALTDTDFSAQYCQITSFFNGYNACMLDQINWTNHFVQSTCARSRVDINPFAGGNQHIRGTVDGSRIFDFDMVSAWSNYYNFYMFSGTSIFGCRMNKVHNYTITSPAPASLHWSYRSNMDC